MCVFIDDHDASAGVNVEQKHWKLFQLLKGWKSYTMHLVDNLSMLSTLFIRTQDVHFTNHAFWFMIIVMDNLG